MPMIDILVPAEQEGTKAIVRSWLKKIGDTVAIDDPLVELETDKVTQEVPSPGAGVLVEILLDTDGVAIPGTLLGRLRDAVDEVEATPEAPAEIAASESQSAPTTSSESEMRLSPSVRRAIREHDIDPATITGSGKDGRITRADVDQAAEERAAEPKISSRDEVSPPQAPQPAVPILQPMEQTGGRSTNIPHDRMRRAIAENMLNSVTAAPHVTAVFEADFSAIIGHRKRNKALFEEQGINLTFTAYIMAACVQAMRAAPAINSRWHDDRLELFSDINIGVGTALGEKGLVVPVVHAAQDLSLSGIATRLQDLIKRARANKLAPGDMRGGTFSISNHGVSGSLFASPIIISQPQSAILGVGKLEKRVVVREADGVDTIQIRPMAFVSLTIDHRVVDGHQTNGWLSKFVEVLESWPLEG